MCFCALIIPFDLSLGFGVLCGMIARISHQNACKILSPRASIVEGDRVTDIEAVYRAYFQDIYLYLLSLTRDESCRRI